MQLRLVELTGGHAVLGYRRTGGGIWNLDPLERLRVAAVLVGPDIDRQGREVVESGRADDLAAQVRSRLDRRITRHQTEGPWIVGLPEHAVPDERDRDAL